MTALVIAGCIVLTIAALWVTWWFMGRTEGQHHKHDSILDARTEAFLARIRRAKPSPLALKQIELAALHAVLRPFRHQLPAAMDDPAPADDPVWPMDREPFTDWERDSVVMRALDEDGNVR